MEEFNINDEERERILNLHESATKRQYLKEQSNNSNYGKCKGNVPVDSPVGFIRTIDKRGETYTANFSLKAFFSATKSSSESYRAALKKLKQSIDAQIEKKGYQNKGLKFAKIISISSIEGSASNYLGGSLKPTADRYGKPLSAEKLQQPPYDSLPGEGDSNWNKNLGYAKNRWSNMVNFINKEGESIGFKIDSNINPGDTKSIIRDTGGCIDEQRDAKNYAPGQYVGVLGTVQLVRGDEREKPSEDIIKCGEGLNIVVGYFPFEVDVEGISMKNSYNGHSCNYATYDIFLNGIKIGTSNMNNRLDSGFTLAKVSIGKDEPGYIAPRSTGDRVFTVFEIKSQKLKEISKNTKSGEIEITMKGTEGAHKSNNGKTMHGEAPLVCAAIVEKNGDKRIVYGPGEPFKSSGGHTEPILTKLGSFNPCKTIKKVSS